MTGFIFRRIVNGLLVIGGVIVIIFFLFTVLPADPARMMLGQRADSASVALINKDLGIDQPVSTQFLLYVNDLSPLSFHSIFPESRFFADPKKYEVLFSANISENKKAVIKYPYLRRSYQSKRHVWSVLLEKFPDTAVLALTSILFASVAGIGLGIISAMRKNSFTDRLIMVIALSGVSIPSFFAAVIFAWLFGFVLGDITGLNMTGGLFDIDPFTGVQLNLKNLILPALVLGLRPMSIIVQLTRSSMLDVLNQDFMRTAKAKGLSRKKIILRHGLKNALNPVVTAISGWLGSLLAGAVFIEFIFGWNGLGKLTVTALENYDMPVVMGIVLFISCIFILLNIIADILNAWLDPRIRLSAG